MQKVTFGGSTFHACYGHMPLGTVNNAWQAGLDRTLPARTHVFLRLRLLAVGAMRSGRLATLQSGREKRRRELRHFDTI